MTRPSKTCQHCRQRFEKSPRRGREDWEARKFCGNACTIAARRGAAPTAPTAPVQTKICELCGDEYQRRPKVGDAGWEARRFCGNECGNRSRRKPKAVKPAEQARPTKKCARCGVVFERPKGITHKRWEVRQFCGGVCRAAAQQPPPPPPVQPRPTKKCVQCGKVFERPINLGDARWEKRLYCSKDCQWAVTQAAGVVASPVTSPRRKVEHAPTHTHPTPSAPPQRVWRPANIGRDMRPKTKESA